MGRDQNLRYCPIEKKMVRVEKKFNWVAFLLWLITLWGAVGYLIYHFGFKEPTRCGSCGSETTESSPAEVSSSPQTSEIEWQPHNPEASSKAGFSNEQSDTPSRPKQSTKTDSAFDPPFSFEERKHMVEAMAAQKLGSTFGYKKTLESLPGLLDPDERLINLASGQYENRSGLLAITNRRLIFHSNQNMLSSRTEDILLTKISSIQTQEGVTGGKVKAHTSGNTAEISFVTPSERAGEIGTYVRKKIRESPSEPGGGIPGGGKSEDVVSKIDKLNQLRREGAVSEEEYQKLKDELIG